MRYDSSLPVGIVIGVAIFLAIILTFIPSPSEARKDEMNLQLRRIADALEVIVAETKRNQ